MRYSAQIRAARALLGIRQDELAKAAKIGLATLQRIEQTEGLVQANFSTVLKIQTALERSGIEFTEQDEMIGVRLKARKKVDR
jgi:transcriptional regulator with XRE-family HTH domain